MIKNIERTKDGLDELIDRAHDAAVGTADRAERGVGSTAKRAVMEARVAGDHVREATDTAARGAHRGVKRAALAVDRGYTRARGDLSRAATAATDYVTANPGKTLLLAASAGFVLGMLVRRRPLSA